MKNRRELSTSDPLNALQISLGKLGALDTQQKALEEIKDYLRQYKRSEDKISFFLSSLIPSNEHVLSMNHKKEFIRLYGTIAEVLEAAAIPYLTRIFSALLKRLKEGNCNLNDVISQSYGAIVHNTLHTLPDLPSSCSQLNSILKPLFDCLNSSSKTLQIGAGLCITKIIQHSPLECLRYLLEKITIKLTQLLATSKAQGQIVEAIISLVLSVEQEFAGFTSKVVPEVLNCVNSEDFACRKQVIDAIYTLGAVVPQSVAPFAKEIMNVLNRVRTDKIKPVRDSAVEAINLYKKFAPETSPKIKAKVLSPKEEPKPKSIFKGPINANFFKAANNDSVVEAPEKPIFYKEDSYSSKAEEQELESPRSASPVFKENSRIEKFDFEDSVNEGRDANQKLSHLSNQAGDLRSEFKEFKDQVKSELYQMNQRLGALEEMITTVSQLFDAKLKQLLCNPNIANLLRN